MHSAVETLAYLEECDFAINQLFQTLKERVEASRCSRERLSEIARAEGTFASVFIDRDQWSPAANSHYARYMETMEALAEQKKRIGSDPDGEAQVRELLARLGATEQSMAILAGSILQIGKQVLAFRFGSKPDLQQVRRIGTQTVVDVVWEGRNHALHWEDPNPHPKCMNMLQKLRQESGVEIVPGTNNAVAILAALGWSDVKDVVGDMRELIKVC